MRILDQFSISLTLKGSNLLVNPFQYLELETTRNCSNDCFTLQWWNW